MGEGRANGRRVELMEREKGGETGGDGRRMVIQFCNMRASIFCKHYPPRVYHLVLVVQPSWDLCQTGRLLHHSNVPQLLCNHIRPQLTTALYSGDVKVGDHSVVPTTYIICGGDSDICTYSAGAQSVAPTYIIHKKLHKKIMLS